MRFEKQTFTTDITLDYNEFIDCEIKDCVVFFHGGTFSLIRTKLTNVRFGLSGAAHQTLMFLRLVRSSGPHLLDQLLDQGPQPEKQDVPTIT